MNDQFIALKNELDNYVGLFDQYSDNKELPRWKAVFVSTIGKLWKTLQSECVWESKRGAIIDVLYLFAPRMGSFREECPTALMDKSQGIITAAHDCLRYCWAMEGKETYSIPQEELLSVGDKVNMVKGELLSLGFGGHQEIADFVENHPYEIIALTGNDISNMPTYNIKFGQAIRNARHNSIVKIG